MISFLARLLNGFQNFDTGNSKRHQSIVFRLGRRVGFTIDFDQSISIPDLDATPVCPDKLVAFKYVKNIGNGGAPDAKHNSEILQGFDHEEIFLPGDAKNFFLRPHFQGPERTVPRQSCPISKVTEP